MEKKGVSLSHIRALLIAQEGRCAITGLPLDPSDVNGDHIIPISRPELSPPPAKRNIWLVAKKINAMKGTMTYDELVQVAHMVIAHEAKSRKLIHGLINGEIGDTSKEVFDAWVMNHCDPEGKVAENHTEL